MWARLMNRMVRPSHKGESICKLLLLTRRCLMTSDFLSLCRPAGSGFARRPALPCSWDERLRCTAQAGVWRLELKPLECACAAACSF